MYFTYFIVFFSPDRASCRSAGRAPKFSLSLRQVEGSEHDKPWRTARGIHGKLHKHPYFNVIVHVFILVQLRVPFINIVYFDKLIDVLQENIAR